MMGAEFVQLSLTPILIGTLSAIACALPGNFLILRRQALIGDAISHVVLPGIVVAFLVTGSLASLPMLAGAAGAALVAVFLIETIRRLGRIEPGAAMGVVFTSMFAGGVLLLEQSDTSGVHLDVEHALMGNLESLIWFDATGWASLLDPAALAGLPPELPRIALVAAAITVLMLVFCGVVGWLIFFVHGRNSSKRLLSWCNKSNDADICVLITVVKKFRRSRRVRGTNPAAPSGYVGRSHAQEVSAFARSQIKTSQRIARPEASDLERNCRRDIAHINESRFLHIGFPICANEFGRLGKAVVFANQLQLHLRDHSVAELR